MTSSTESIVLEGHGLTDTGERPINEDVLLVRADLGLFGVFDGVGGNPAGDQASRLVADVAERGGERLSRDLAAAPPPSELVPRRVLDALQRDLGEASERVFARTQENPELREMAASALVLRAAGPALGIAHVGNGRAWLVRKGRAHRLTEEHTLGWQLVRQGALRAEDVPTFPYRNVLTRAVGKYPSVAVDLLRLEVGPGDAVVLASRGVTSVVETDEIADCVERVSVAEAAAEILGRAVRRRTRHNASVVVVRVTGDAPSAERLLVEQKVSFLKGNVLFRELSFQEIVRILRVVDEVDVPEGDVVFREGEAGDELFLVVAGRVGVRQGAVELTRIGTGGHFGELSLVLSPLRSATVTALERTRLLRLGRRDFEGILRDEPALGNKLLLGMLQNVGDRVRTLSREVAEARGRGEAT